MHEELIQELIPKARRRRRTYSAQFKAEMVAQCMAAGVSQAAIAIEHDMNPNVLRRWVVEHERLGLHELGDQPSASTASAGRTPTRWLPFVPVQAPAVVATPVAAAGPAQPPSTGHASATIQVDLAARGLTMTIRWPVSEHPALAQWARQVLA